MRLILIPSRIDEMQPLIRINSVVRRPAPRTAPLPSPLRSAPLAVRKSPAEAAPTE
ncbi:hypothetical protein JYU34_008380 [Plutella xylostella]|uniref:Uncharacterized protein n=1 Tax=Plutella xylostella TaxID=51655 RepID=A0ABQ7QKY2_PLUXY|nr:hypothetical protein JYU34_008380 [Plutella xylostella]